MTIMQSDDLFPVYLFASFNFHLVFVQYVQHTTIRQIFKCRTTIDYNALALAHKHTDIHTHTQQHINSLVNIRSIIFISCSRHISCDHKQLLYCRDYYRYYSKDVTRMQTSLVQKQYKIRSSWLRPICVFVCAPLNTTCIYVLIYYHVFNLAIAPHRVYVCVFVCV